MFVPLFYINPLFYAYKNLNFEFLDNSHSKGGYQTVDFQGLRVSP